MNELEKRFKVPSSTISKWVRDIAVKSPQYTRAREFELKEKSRFKDPPLRVDKNNARLFASLLYWCEGSKHPSSNALAFSNSDPAMVHTFISLLRQGFRLDKEKLRVHLQIHTTHEPKKVFQFWSELLGIKREYFHKPTITRPTRKMKRASYLGTCTVKYYDVRLLLQLMGIYERFAERWLSGRKRRLAKALYP